MDKKERTPAQKRATASMLAKMKERREKGEKVGGRKKKEIEGETVEIEIDEPIRQKPQPAPAPAPVPPQREPQNYITKDDFHSFRNEIASLIKPPPSTVIEKPIKKPARRVRVIEEDEMEQEEEQPQKVYKPIEKKTIPKPQQSLTGYSLIDALLNRK